MTLKRETLEPEPQVNVEACWWGAAAGVAAGLALSLAIAMVVHQRVAHDGVGGPVETVAPKVPDLVFECLRFPDGVCRWRNLRVDVARTEDINERHPDGTFRVYVEGEL